MSEEKKEVKEIFGNFECSDTVNGIDIKFLTGVNRFRIEPHEGLKSAMVITEEELNAIAKFTKGFRIPKFYTQQELNKALEIEAGDSNTLYEMMKKKHKEELDKAREEQFTQKELGRIEELLGFMKSDYPASFSKPEDKSIEKKLSKLKE